MEPQKNFGPNFLGFTPQNRLFCPTPWDQLATLRKLRLYRGWTPIPAKLWPVQYICSTEPWRRAVPVWSCNANKLLVVDHQSMVFRYQMCQFLGTTSISAKWNSATPIPAKWPYPPKKIHLCGNFVEIFGEIFLGHPEHWVKGVFEKNGTQFGQFLPRWPHLQSATPYMASPPCTIFHNPDLKWNIVQQCTTG